MTEEINWSAPNPNDAPQPPSGVARVGGEEIATFWWRLLGRILDWTNALVLSLGLFLAAGLILTVSNAEEGSAIATLISLVTLGLVVGLRVMWEGNGGSPFRRGIGVLIVDQNTFQPIGPWRALIRVIVGEISFLFFGLGFLWMLWDKNSQTWHDKAAGSVVVKR